MEKIAAKFYVKALSFADARLTVSMGDDTRGVFKITKASILESVLPEGLKSEGPSIYLLATPDECLEIVGFAEPKVILASQDR